MKSNFSIVKKSIVAISLLAFAGVSHAGASVTAKASTLGLGLETSFDLDDKWGFAAGFNGFSYDYDTTKNNVAYDGNIRFKNADFSARYFPWSSGFFLSGGLLFNYNEVELTAKPKGNATYTFNGQTYSASDVGFVEGYGDFDKLAPKLSIGWQKKAGKGFSVFAEAGVAFTGAPDLTVSVSCNPSLPAAQCTQLKSDVEKERQDLVKDAEDFKLHPVVALGAQYRF